MKLQFLLDEFDRAEKEVLEAWSNDRVAQIVRHLKALTQQYTGHTKLPQLQRRELKKPLAVTDETRWG